MIRKAALAVAMAVAAAALPAIARAQESAIVVTARQAGLIGERYDGYLGVAGAISAEQRRQVATINIKRRKLYHNFAVEHGVGPQEVGITAACTLLGAVQVGQAYLLSDGQWRRRAAGEAAPRPAYCG